MTQLARQKDEPEYDHGQTETLNSGMTKHVPLRFQIGNIPGALPQTPALTNNQDMIKGMLSTLV